MIRCVAAGILTVSLASGTRADEPLLIHGSPAPNFQTGEFVRGPALSGLAPGTIYVIEFSGTQCVPCIKMIPHLEALQRTYNEVVFLSVFCEPADDVRRFLDGPGKAITLRVVCDPDQILAETWSLAAAQFGVPHAFVVDAEGKIAWIGNPADLDGPLARVVAGEPVAAVDPVEAMRRRVKREVIRAGERLAEREVQAEEENRRIVTSLIQGGEPEQALRELDRLIATYRDLPDNVEAYRARKLFVLGLIPGRGEEAFALALELAVEARRGGRPAVPSAAHYFMNHYERCLPENRDERMLHLAVEILSDAAVPEGASRRGLQDRSRHFAALARAHDLQGDRARAAAALRQAIAAEEGLIERFRAEGSDSSVIEGQKSRIDELNIRLAAYKAD